MWPKAYFCNEFFAPRYWAKVGATPTPPSGQSPSATRYRDGHRVNWVHRVVWIVATLGAFV